MHFLTNRERDRADRIGRLRAAVTVRFERRGGQRTLNVEPGIKMLTHDALIVPLPKNVLVLDEDGKAIQPVGTFYVTLESFDPFHLLADIF